MDLDPQILRLEPPEYYHYLLICCCVWPITRSARFAAILSLLSFTVNLVLLLCSSIYSTWQFLLEFASLLLELICILCLFYGISRKRAGYLKPFIFFGFIWNILLVILLIICLIQLFDKNGFRFDVLLNLSEFIELEADLETFESTSFWLTVLLIVGLIVTIIIGFWFLHIVLSAYHYFVYRSGELWDQQPEHKQLLTNERPETVKVHKTESADSDPAKEVFLPKELRQDC
ncbi:hypothetical protein M3Y97_00215100 [Aphelenchoides bicaudatus]|nr:hypothetical protein M3Y97_00215100 [Aphelenchoides bicaudatus]